MAAAAWLVDSDWSGVSVLMTPELIGLMILQSAAETPVAAADAAADEAAAAAEADVLAAAETGALVEELEELLHPARRAPPTATTARADIDERWNIICYLRGERN
jgi:hypothetical protein